MKRVDDKQLPDRSAADSVVQRLRAALEKDGDFPIRARVANELRKEISNPQVQHSRIVELILSESSLATKLLSVSNSALYLREAKVTTVSQAVVQLGLDGLADLCTGLVLIQQFARVAKRGGVFADNVSRGILVSILTTQFLDSSDRELNEQGYLAGTFYNLGTLLLSFYFPQLFETSAVRAKKRGQSLTKSLAQTLGAHPLDLSIGVIKSLSIPDLYSRVLEEALEIHTQSCKGQPAPLAQSLVQASTIADAVIDSADLSELLGSLENVGSTVSKEELTQILRDLPEQFAEQCEIMGLSALKIPNLLHSYGQHIDDPDAQTSIFDEKQPLFASYSTDIEQAIINNEALASVIASAMEALSYGLDFERVLLLVPSKSRDTLVGKMSIGEAFPFNPRELEISLAEQSSEAAEVAAFQNGDIQVYGSPSFDGNWPFAAVPIGTQGNSLGVLYADNANQNSIESLDPHTLAAMYQLANLLNIAVKKLK